MSAAARARQVAVERGLLDQLGRIDRTKLSPDTQVDAALLENALRYDIWDAETLQSWAWDPQVYNDAAGSALYALAARDFVEAARAIGSNGWRVMLRHLLPNLGTLAQPLEGRLVEADHGAKRPGDQVQLVLDDQLRCPGDPLAGAPVEAETAVLEAQPVSVSYED